MRLEISSLAGSAGAAFYRAESAQARDLAVLAAAVLKQEGNGLRVFEVLAGCGIRSKRYLQQAGATQVWANDGNYETGHVLHSNLASAFVDAQGHTLPEGWHHLGEDAAAWTGTPVDSQATCIKSLRPANEVLLQAWQDRLHKHRTWSLIDLDSFGSSGGLLAMAVAAVEDGGLLYATCTDGLASGGRNPVQALAAYGTWTQPVPYANEMGIRMLIGGAIAAAAKEGRRVQPVFSLYAPHGPCFRSMLRVSSCSQAADRLQDYKYLAHSKSRGSRVLPAGELHTAEPDERAWRALRLRGAGGAPAFRAQTG